MSARPDRPTSARPGEATEPYPDTNDERTSVPPKRELILIRHGEAELRGRYVGRTDPPLSECGRSQAVAVARRLADEPLLAVYSSPLQRARDTAQAIGGLHCLRVKEVPDLAELDFGAWDGLSYGEIERRDPERLSRWLSDPVAVCPPGGESLAHLAQRVMAATHHILAQYPRGTSVIVSHGGPIRVIVCEALGLPLGAQWRIGQALAGLTRVEWYGGGDVVLSLLNDTAHLWRLRPQRCRRADQEAGCEIAGSRSQMEGRGNG